jgi:hypothetical protein
MRRELDAAQQQELLELLRSEIRAAYSSAVAAGTPAPELDELLDARINQLKTDDADGPACVTLPE